MLKTRLVCSYDYTRKLNPNLSEEDWDKLVETGKRFEPMYKKETPKIIGLIPRYTGFNWNEQGIEEIPIYLANFNGPSRTNPITIKISNLEEMLLKVIHELAHINMPNKFLRLNNDTYEDLVNQVTLKVTEEIGLNTSTVKIEKFREEILKKGAEVIDVKLDLMNVKSYFMCLNFVEQTSLS
ncbi:MAG: hypothetical protein ABIJ14_01675 [Nanoarchaeota archaeon]